MLVNSTHGHRNNKKDRIMNNIRLNSIRLCLDTNAVSGKCDIFIYNRGLFIILYIHVLLLPYMAYEFYVTGTIHRFLVDLRKSGWPEGG